MVMVSAMCRMKIRTGTWLLMSSTVRGPRGQRVRKVRRVPKDPGVCKARKVRPEPRDRKVRKVRPDPRDPKEIQASQGRLERIAGTSTRMA